VGLMNELIINRTFVKKDLRFASRKLYNSKTQKKKNKIQNKNPKNFRKNKMIYLSFPVLRSVSFFQTSASFVRFSQMCQFKIFMPLF
jgi:hypothetical protein